MARDSERRILREGETLGAYLIDKILGYGGMAVVYRAKQQSLNRWVALKVLNVDSGDDDHFRERFRREGMSVAALRHAGIVTVFDQGEADGLLFIAMELIEGRTLGERIRSPGLSVRETLDLLAPIADALDAAHDAGVAHRDVKPHNILLDHLDRPYLADFGIAKAAGELGQTSPGGFVGSVAYAAPEQFRGEATSLSDVYAFTAVLYECLTGEVPFPRDNDAASMWAHLEEAPPRIGDRTVGVPAELDDAIARGLNKDPGLRPQRASALIADVRAAVCRMDEASLTRVPAFPAPQRDLADAPRPQRDSDDILAPTREPERRRLEVVGAAAPPPGADRPGADRPGADLPGDRNGTKIDPLARALAPVEVAPRAPWFERLSRLASAPATERPGPLAAIVIVSLLAPATALALRAEPGAATRHEARAGQLVLTYAGGWAPTANGAPAGLRKAVALRSSAAPTLRVRAGAVASPARIPGGLWRQVADGTTPVRSASVKLGALQARRYDREAPGLQQQLRIYVVASERGDFAITCAMARDEARAGLRACDALASSARLTGVGGRPPGVDAAVAIALRKALAALDAKDDELGHGLAVRSLERRSAAATGLARAHRAAAASIAELRPSTRDARALATLRRRLGQLADDYTALAERSKGASRRRYNDARDDQKRHQQLLRRALAELVKLGYDRVP